MGSLILPDSGVVYVDANCVIYAVEKIKPYDAVLEPLWLAAADGQFSMISSELSVLECLVRPLREKNLSLEASFLAFLLDSEELRLAPVELSVIRQAAQLRSDTGLKTPDAIHAATALAGSASLFVTNDPAFRRVPGLPVAILSEILDSP